MKKQVKFEDIQGKVVFGARMSNAYGSILISFEDGTFCYVDVTKDYDGGFEFRDMFPLRISDVEHRHLIELEIMTKEEIDSLNKKNWEESEKARESFEYATYVRLKKKFEEGT